jgi:hypothetical protein
MSVWNDGGPAGAAGGQSGQGEGGHTVSPGGAGGGMVGGASGGSSIVVPGGVRDLATTQCTSTSGGTCPVPSSYLQCLESSCGTNLTACYYSDGVSSAAGGACRSYANCMLACPCNSGRSNCETSCMQSYAMADPTCSTCMLNLLGCASTYGCNLPTSCAADVSTGVGGAAGRQ